ncbi:hypothetical protein IMG5_102480 [Ichthyophthirius multifiliis]|uniref:Uncharacterized protein n=1 Tax=Ichthyophthirius multifiliis TaxID=5932 RepID=G0QSN2_ICHMU|nr:hypothetical protein IMG5_102480 [Ichthyophthirius multifiliis]EGR31748.1 hypothetical protein IMG5_102480 [Ichthyophthirius multifiliis]|eukprot:XP_004035234.1 hypothetical protein IMG5_102480 [Ichthyophthirius multifiliis]
MILKNIIKWQKCTVLKKLKNLIYKIIITEPIKFEVFDYDSPTSSDFIGDCHTTIGKIVGSKNCTLVLDLKDKKDKFSGKIIIRAEKVNQCNDEIILKIQGKKIKDMRFWTKSSPFLVFSRITENNFPLKVLETKHKENNLQPLFDDIKIKAQKLCNADYNMPILIECMDYNSNGKHDFIGSTQFSVNEAQIKKEYKLKDKKYNDAGTLFFNNFQLIRKPQFIDFIRGGVQLNLVIAIDFTGSNGIPSASDSLHAIQNNGQFNSYQQAIKLVGDILLNYDADQQIPMYGFGAKPKLPNFYYNQTMHCFPLNGNPQNPDVHGMNGILNCYQQVLKFLEFSGPTLFNPLLTETQKIAQFSKVQNYQNYYIMLILTDGEIHDMDATIQTIVDMARLPISIIIIGIGSQDFEKMHILDGDDGLIDYRGRKAERDLVQFVEFNTYKNNIEALQREVLAELPDQVVEYFRLIGEEPKQVQYQRMESIQVQNIPQANMNFGQNLIQAGFMQNILQSVQNQGIQENNKPLNQQQQQFYQQYPQNNQFYPQKQQQQFQSEKQAQIFDQPNQIFGQNISKAGFMQNIVQNINMQNQDYQIAPPPPPPPPPPGQNY